MIAQINEDTTNSTTLELLFHISRELSSALDLRTVLQRVLFLSMKRVEAISGTIIVLDDLGKPVDSAIITGELFQNHTTQRLLATLDLGLAGWVVRYRQAALVANTSQDERWMQRIYPDGPPETPKSAVSAPLITREQLVGVMTLVHPQPGFFTPAHLALVQTIADQASIAVLNARLYAESQRQARVMTGLVNSAAGISVSLSLEDVLDGILEQSSLALDAQVVSLALIDPADGMLVYRAVTGVIKSQLVNTCLKPGQGVAGWVALHDESIIISHVEQDERFDPETDNQTGFKTTSIACAPIHYRGEVIGTLEALNPKSGNFDPDALLLLNGIGSLAGTAIRHAQLFEQLQAAHQSYRELFEDSIDPILITDQNGQILETNRKAGLASDYTPEDLHAMRINQLHAVALDIVGDGYQNLFTGITLKYESRLRTRSGHELPIEVYVRQINTNHGTRLQWILRDITERKNLDILRNDLTSMIYHDLRSPLANVVSSLNMLDGIVPKDKDPAMKSLLEIALRSTMRIQRLTDSLLDMNRLEAGQEIGNRQKISLAGIIQEIYGTIQPIVLNKEQEISINLPDDLPDVFVDPEMIQRVISNLLENATKYTQRNGHIQVGACLEAGMVQAWVRDDGLGIPASEHERVFDKFSRVNLLEAPKGLGLGLAYCRLVVQGHGGRIWVESEPGKGSNFIFTLPVAKETT